MGTLLATFGKFGMWLLSARGSVRPLNMSRLHSPIQYVTPTFVGHGVEAGPRDLSVTSFLRIYGPMRVALSNRMGTVSGFQKSESLCFF